MEWNFELAKHMDLKMFGIFFINKNRALLFGLCVVWNSSCAHPLKGDWEGIEKYTSGDPDSMQAIPYEECYPQINSETGEFDANTNCIKRGFLLHVENSEEVQLEATNDQFESHTVNLYTEMLARNLYFFSDASSIRFTCSTQDSNLDCDFSNSGGYLGGTRIIFSPHKDAQ